jgi:hypothetical protein
MPTPGGVGAVAGLAWPIIVGNGLTRESAAVFLSADPRSDAMSRLSRRGLLLAATAGALAPAIPAYAATPAATLPASNAAAQGRVPLPEATAASAECVPTAGSSGVMQASGSLGSVAAAVRIKILKDVVALRYELTNTGDTRTTYVVSYTDQVTTFDSRAIDQVLEPGERRHGVLYGGLGHDFLFYVDLPDGTMLTLGPLNRLPSCKPSSRRVPKPVYQPPPCSHGPRDQEDDIRGAAAGALDNRDAERLS